METIDGAGLIETGRQKKGQPTGCPSLFWIASQELSTGNSLFKGMALATVSAAVISDSRVVTIQKHKQSGLT